MKTIVTRKKGKNKLVHKLFDFSFVTNSKGKGTFLSIQIKPVTRSSKIKPGTGSPKSKPVLQGVSKVEPATESPKSKPATRSPKS